MVILIGAVLPARYAGHVTCWIVVHDTLWRSRAAQSRYRPRFRCEDYNVLLVLFGNIHTRSRCFGEWQASSPRVCGHVGCFSTLETGNSNSNTLVVTDTSQDSHHQHKPRALVVMFQQQRHIKHSSRQLIFVQVSWLFLDFQTTTTTTTLLYLWHKMFNFDDLFPPELTKLP